ncbi:MAG: hypothetical protein IJI46_03645 [Erysipelotrichaceae bacterium]|nr:hypothetical protein [Erysipelotrichaceae bacterium]
MKEITCKNCGAVFSDELDKCPYCGTMNKKGAYKKFRQKVSAFIDMMLGLKQETHRSISRGILAAVLRSLIMIAIIVLAAYLFSKTVRVNYYNDKEYDEKALEQIMWVEENYEKLDEAYEKGDYQTIEKLYYQNSGAVTKWHYYPIYALKSAYQDIMDDKYFNEYTLQDVMYFLFYPDHYIGYNGKIGDFYDEYELLKGSLTTWLNTKGYSVSELEEAYRSKCDSYGYVVASDLKELLKEGGNG